MTVFDEVRSLVTVADAARFYGYTLNRSGFICCPFHNEKTASLKIYADGFKCFGCGAHGSVLDFVALLFGTDVLAAVKRLNDDFNLQLDLDRPPDSEALRQRQKVQEARKRFDEWRDKMLLQMGQCIRIANLVDFTNVTAAEAMALRFRETFEAWADCLIHGSLDEQMEIFRDREEVERLCQRILNNTQTKSTAA